VTMPRLSVGGVSTGSLAGWFEANLDSLVTVPLQIALVVAIAVVLRLLARRFINRAVQRMVEAPTKASRRRRRSADSVEGAQAQLRERRRQRGQTIGSVLRSAASILIFSVAAVVALGEIGIDIAPIIASAGILGLAFGFGAQSLVSDFIAGLFMLMEDQYGVGDWVDVDGTQGTVEEVGLRVTKLRDMDGAAWYVRNGQVLKIGNYSQDWACSVLDVPISYDQDVETASRLLEQAAWSLWDDPEWREYVLDAPQIWGMTSLAREALVLRVSVNTVPLQQWGVGRELRRRVKESFDRESIAIPHLSQQVWKQPGEAEDTGPATPVADTTGSGSTSSGTSGG
jgi:moderate conductance mechanosensitive channel